MPDMLIFDFDGVILDSVGIKDEAFHDLFEDATEKQKEEVLQFHRSTPGLPRQIKIERILTEVLKRPLNRDSVTGALDRYSKIVWDRVTKCPEVHGIRSYLEEQANIPKYIVSASPQGELNELTRARGLTPYFKGIFGGPGSKSALLRAILEKEDIRPSQVLMYGDKTSDLEAASDVGIQFVARVTGDEEEGFPESIERIEDFTEVLRNDARKK
jgi:phosphoglycolate phosphatase-like HAD superfamily hydrolase